MTVKRHTPNILQHPFYLLQKVLNPYEKSTLFASLYIDTCFYETNTGAKIIVVAKQYTPFTIALHHTNHIHLFRSLFLYIK